jgi:hypothetical protein
MAAMLVSLTMDANEKSFVHGTPTWRRWRHVKTLYSYAQNIYHDFEDDSCYNHDDDDDVYDVMMTWIVMGGKGGFRGAAPIILEKFLLDF